MAYGLDKGFSDTLDAVRNYVSVMVAYDMATGAYVVGKTAEQIAGVTLNSEAMMDAITKNPVFLEETKDLGDPDKLRDFIENNGQHRLNRKICLSAAAKGSSELSDAIKQERTAAPQSAPEEGRGLLES